ncbi:MAG: DNA double-strand break repair nuclease NurA [Cyanothece sp. SIO2G6]|nr:DNA double-strand break repair nuclease NurA [Cyanothece sp. SIO2G6]
MTLKPAQIQAILQAKQSDFQQFDQRSLTLLKQYRERLASLSDCAEMGEYPVDESTSDYGARLLESFQGSNRGSLACDLTWANREASMAWVRQVLTDVTTFAVDGSQIFAGKDLSIPVALVQIGWFENSHSENGGYEKDIDVDVMTPSELKAHTSGDPVDRRVNFRRLEMEVNRLVQYMDAQAQAIAQGKKYLVFYDGSLAATFANDFEPKLKQAYVDCLLRLLRTSQTHRVPLVAYVDTTYSRDLTVMLKQAFELPDVPSIHDAQLVNPYMDWGDRTPLMLSQRTGILRDYEEQQDQITFTYLKTTRLTYPARLEMPLWIYEDGIADQVIDWVRGEVIIGGGYPYAIETADQTAVLRSGDRQTFFRILQDWADEMDLNLRLSRKMVSKSRRRY